MKYLRFILISLLLLSLMAGTAALAEGCYVGCDECSRNSDCASCEFCIAVTATARPRQEAPQPIVTKRPVAQKTPAPTQKPVATRVPEVAATVKPVVTSTPSASMGDYTTFPQATQEEIALQLLNQDRIRNGLPALTLDPALSRIARIKSQDMKDNRYFAHESPTYGRAPQMLTHFGYAYNGVGENIAHHATVEKSQAAFMSSTGHRANILGRQWQKVGIGVVFDDHGYVYVTQLFVR